MRAAAILAGALLLAALFLVLDLWLPSWGAGGVPYVALVCAGWFLRRRRTIVGLGLLFSLLVVAGAVRGQGVEDPWFDLSGRFLALLGIWVVVAFLLLAKRAEAASRESAAQFRNLIEGSIQGVLIHRDGKALFANQAFAEAFGYDGPEEVLALPSIRCMEAEHERARLSGYAAARMAGGRPPNRYEFEGVRKDGTGVWLENFATLVQWDGAPAVRSTSVNITERKQAEQALVAKESVLQQRVLELESAQRALEDQGASLIRFADDLKNAREQAELANIAKSQFLASVSHELRTPLNAIMGFAEVIKDEMFGAVGSASYRDYAKDIYQSGEHLLKLINDILDLSKVESGNMELHEEAVDADGLIASVVRLVRQRADGRRVSLRLEVADDLPALSVDERKVKQVLVNLLSNAIKFTEAGGTVTLKAWCHLDSGFVFQVIDTGIGMAPHDIPKALSQFGQIDGDLNRKYEGTGLGLPLSKSLIELHGGSLDLQSQPGVGTTATVRFPAARIVLLESLPIPPERLPAAEVA